MTSAIGEIERELSTLRTGDGAFEPAMRTSVMTHLAWVPDEWLPAAHEVLHGLAERHPSRTIVLVPDSNAEDGMEARVESQCFPVAGTERSICTETIELRLGGAYASRPASIVTPLLISALPVFCRWRGEPPWRAPEFEQLVDLVDRMVIDSREWRDPAAGYRQIVDVFDRTAVSDIAWSLTYDWRVKLASFWPTIAEQEIRVRGPVAEASLLRAWLGARLRRAMRPVESADELEVQLGGERIPPIRREKVSPADLLSNELDRFSRDRIYEEAVRVAVG
jgi:glucose-6-phosphate dehydrogenase assembly protein OpcA